MFWIELGKSMPAQQVLPGTFASVVGPSSVTTKEELGFALSVSCRGKVNWHFTHCK